MTVAQHRIDTGAHTICTHGITRRLRLLLTRLVGHEAVAIAAEEEKRSPSFIPAMSRYTALADETDDDDAGLLPLVGRDRSVDLRDNKPAETSVDDVKGMHNKTDDGDDEDDDDDGSVTSAVLKRRTLPSNATSSSTLISDAFERDDSLLTNVSLRQALSFVTPRAVVVG